MFIRAIARAPHVSWMVFAAKVSRMVEMSMNRVIHAALRRDLDRFAGALALFADGDSSRARRGATAIAGSRSRPR